MRTRDGGGGVVDIFVVVLLLLLSSSFVSWTGVARRTRRRFWEYPAWGETVPVLFLSVAWFLSQAGSMSRWVSRLFQ